VKEFYKISEIAKLYDICNDTLRYYEEEQVLYPIRSSNNYRLYGIQDICNLNIIRNLRSLDMPMTKIRYHINNRTVENTLNMLIEEEQLINDKIAKLKALSGDVRKRFNRIQETIKQPVHSFRIIEIEPRPCFRLTEDIIIEKEIDFLLKKLEKKHEGIIHILGDQQMGATLDTAYLKKGIYNHFSYVFFISNDFKDFDALIPGGTYASTIYSGQYENLQQILPELLEFIQNRDLMPDGAPMELYLIDTHETKLHEEYLTEVQVKVKPKSE
jgi:DNA-binding transcriptional MerR regulator